MQATTRQNSITVLLVNRTYLYRLLHNFFGNEPSADAINILNSDHTLASLSLLSIEEDVSLTTKFSDQLCDNFAETLDTCRSEYNRLFIGPDKLPAPPWESVYVAKERVIFQESTLKVRQKYLKYHYLPTHYRSEADDHIALELDFMAKLSQLTDTAFHENKINEVSNLLIDQLAFLEEHLLPWVPRYVADFTAATTHPLYQRIASILHKFLQTDCIVVQEITASL